MKHKVRVAGIVALAAVSTPGAVGTLDGCQLQGVCDGAAYWYDGNLAATLPPNIHQPVPVGSGLYDADEWWQSGPVDGEWIDFPGERTVILFPNGLATPVGTGVFQGPYPNVIAYISPDQNANAPGNSWTSSGGNTSEISVHAPDLSQGGDRDWYVSITNASCAHFYLRVTVQQYLPDASADAAAPAAPDDASIDAASGDAASGDAAASEDGGVDAAQD